MSAVAMMAGLAACDDGGDAGASDTRTPDDTAVAPDTSAGDSATIAPEDTSVAPDTAVAEDTAVTPDTAPPEDTAVAPDTTPPEDTTVAPDTSVVEDTSAPTDVATNPTGERLTFDLASFTVQPGKERQVCRTVNMPEGGPWEVVRFESSMLGLSHHFNLYKVIDGSAFDPVTEEETTVHDCSPAAEQLSGDAAYIFGSATPERVMETPAGVAFDLKPGQRLILEYHAINYTTEPMDASLQIDLVMAAPEVEIEHHADIIWFANWGFLLPPGETSDTASCAVPYDVEVFGLMSHFHELGTHFTVETDRDGERELVYEDDDWKHPLYQPFSPAMSLAQGDRLRWTCTWNNTRGQVVTPNKGSKDEMCMVFAAAYPKVGLSAEPIQCNVFF